MRTRLNVTFISTLFVLFTSHTDVGTNNYEPYDFFKLLQGCS
jgi:hypothetical protein